MNFFQDEMFPHSDMTNMSIRDFEQSVDSGDMVVPEYQRKFVWSKAQQQGYLLSISRGSPLFGVVINTNLQSGIKSVMDGQNRLWTIYNFLKDKIKFLDEDDNAVIFSTLSVNQQRLFRTTTISYLETRGWTTEDCQDFFVAMNGGGVKLKAGELINSDRENLFTKMIISLGVHPDPDDDREGGTYYDILAAKAKDGGFQLSPGYMKRYGHYEILGTIFHMAGTGDFPIRPGVTSLGELPKWRGQSESSIFKETIETMGQIMDQHKLLLANVPRLRQKVKKEDHLRVMFFMLKTELYLQELDESHFSRIEHIMNIVLNKDNPEYSNIITWGTGDCMKIFDLYQTLYEAC